MSVKENASTSGKLSRKWKVGPRKPVETGKKPTLLQGTQ
jgi:hypothetical protein